MNTSPACIVGNLCLLQLLEIDLVSQISEVYRENRQVCVQWLQGGAFSVHLMSSVTLCTNALPEGLAR
jgi:hypothetical protein